MHCLMQHTKDDKIFIVKKSTIDNRLDPQFYRINLDLSGFIKLSSIAIVKGGKRIPKGHGYSDRPTNYYYLRVADMDSDEKIDINNLENISEEVFSILKRYEIKQGELAISIAGTIGKTTILDNIPKAQRIILTENCAKILVRPGIGLLPEYLKICMSLPIVKRQLDLNYIQTTIPKLGLDKIMGVRIPPIPCIQKQREIVEYLNTAYSAKKDKDKEAKQLLNGIENYILNELGIKCHKTETSIESRIFNINLGQINIDRLDSSYFDTKYKALCECIISGKYPIRSLDELSTFISTGQTPKSKFYSEVKTNYPIIKAGSYSGFEIDLNKAAYTTCRQPYSVQRGDIFILSAAHQAEYIAKQICYLPVTPAQNTSFVGELICIRAKQGVNSLYLFSLLSTTLYKTLLNREKRGQTSHLYSQDVKRILAPLPPVEIQNRIANHIEKVILRAKQLQIEGKEILDKSKQEIERMITNVSIL